MKLKNTLISTLLILSVLSLQAAEHPSMLPSGKWKLVFQDEFDGPTNNLEKTWEFQNGPSGHILSSRWRDNADIKDGILMLKAKKETRAGQDWTAASAWSRRKFKYGYFECRYRYAKATGTNNSFWMMTRGVPKDGGRFEIDINEGHYPDEINMNIHSWSWKHWAKSKHITMEGLKLAENFHTYGLEWNEHELIWYFDGKEIRREKNLICHREAPVYLSLAIIKWSGPVTDEIDGKSMDVDYVRIYSKEKEFYGDTFSIKAEPARKIVPAPEDPRHRHLSWPKIVKAADGTLLTAYIAGRKHVNGDGCPAVSISKDGGKNFSTPEILQNFDSTLPYQHCANLAMGIAPDGAILLMGMAFTDDLRNNIYCWRSEDNGKTWKLTDTTALGPNKTGSVFGHVFYVPGKGMAVCGHYRNPKGNGIWIAYSKDMGLTWEGPQTITDKKYFEPTFICSDSKIIGLVRENAACAFHQYTSDNLGESWSFEESVIQGCPRANHPSPFIIEDPTSPGTLFALQAERTYEKEIFLWTASNDTLKWKRVGKVAEAPDAEDFGYPWMVHLKGSEWFIVYYAGKKNGSNSIYGKKIEILKDNN